MMRKQFLFFSPSLAIAVSLLSTPLLLAQTSTPPPPPPPPQLPLFLEIPPNTTFSITIQYADTPSQEEAKLMELSGNQTSPTTDRPVFVQFWRDSNNIRIALKHENNVQTEGYLFESGFLVRSTANNEQAFVTPADSGRRSIQSFYTKFFPATQWLDMKFYKGTTQTETGEVFYVFEQPPTNKPLPQLAPGESPPPDFDPWEYVLMTAKLRVPTKYPAEIKIGDTTYQFSPIEKWTGSISLPSNFRQAAENFTQQISIIEAFRKKNQK
ncbi:MAG: hypothetical protein N2035_03040 [Chthoniobacterales bacterium]|nr:hypothetical protein [Chthoniobacterales bacterium]